MNPKEWQQTIEEFYTEPDPPWETEPECERCGDFHVEFIGQYCKYCLQEISADPFPPDDFPDL